MAYMTQSLFHLNDSRERMLEQLLEDYGLDLLISQNEVSELEVLELLVRYGLIDLDMYFFKDNEEENELS
jgi:hypothetical protein